MQPGAAPKTVLLAVLLAGPPGGTGRLLSGQPVCRGGTQKPCYKVIYFHDAFRRLNFEEAREACRRDGGQLVSIESEDEQRLIEKFIENILASDGDFWIGLRRHEDKQNNNTSCQDLYAWTDGSTSEFRNWYVDEPSCGSEVCVVMYHQPSAPAGSGGPYMFQWNDDRCNMKNNFICKYSDGEGTEPATPTSPEETQKEDTKETFKESTGNSPDLEVYNVIRKQSEADLAETRPDLKNISFRVCTEVTPDDLSCDYDNMAVNPSESGFVTLASMESGFVTNDIYEFSPDRIGRSKESGWVENEIYGY
ncbi:Layilin [Tupaia chinensis]|uniref:Layilin n=1 Tax=Tupaia chinensis TaxID=246437 RepID=L9KSR1_TUPCH|nr:Layilin [Tupaia chinensis]